MSQVLTAADIYDLTREPWGGATVSTATGEAVTDGTDAYAVTIKPNAVSSVILPETCTAQEFYAAWHAACDAFAFAPYIGVFHDDAKHTVELDPVIVVTTTAEVDAIAEIYPVEGGAYHFATGNGYWPAGTPALYASSQDVDESEAFAHWSVGGR